MGLEGGSGSGGVGGAGVDGKGLGGIEDRDRKG